MKASLSLTVQINWYDLADGLQSRWGARVAPTAKQINDLTSLIYGAALDPTKWDQVLAELSSVSGGVRTHIFGHDFETHLHLGMIYAGYDPDYVRSYEEHFHARNDWAEGFITFETGKPIYSEQMCSREDLTKGEFYNEWVRPQEDLIAGGGMLLFKEDNRMIGFGGNIRLKDEHKEKDWMELVALVGPHLKQAFEISRKLSGLSLEKHALSQLSTDNSPAILLVDDQGFVVFANQSAELLSETGDLIQIAGNRKLNMQDSALQERMEVAQAALGSGLILAPVSLAGAAPVGARAFECRVATIDPKEVADLHIQLLSGSGAPCLLLTISEIQANAPVLAAFGIEHGLTAAECEVASGFAEGLTLDQIAAARDTSLNTVRNQLKSIMSKTGARRQSDLMRILHQGLARG